jgi:excisionase family DNA binding protein
MAMNLINTVQAAETLGISVRRVRALISEGRLPAQRVGRDYVIQEKDLALVADRKPGRPPMTEEEKAARAKKKAAETSAAKPKARTRKSSKRRSNGAAKAR